MNNTKFLQKKRELQKQGKTTHSIYFLFNKINTNASYAKITTQNACIEREHEVGIYSFLTQIQLRPPTAITSKSIESDEKTIFDCSTKIVKRCPNERLDGLWFGPILTHEK